MTRELKPCGTTAAYRRHLRNGEEPCGECLAANAVAKGERKARSLSESAEVVRLAIVDEPELPQSIDELEEARWNLRIVKATMEAGVSSGMAALSKQYVDLVALVKRLEDQSRPEVSALDQLAQRRAERLAASQD